MTDAPSPPSLLSRGADLLKLAREHPHDRDAAVTFDEPSHTYFVHGVAVSTSVTGVLKAAESDSFDADAVAERMAGSARATPKNSRVNADDGTVTRLTASEIKARWDRARDLGTDLHGKIERYFNGVQFPLADGDDNAYCFGQFLVWWGGYKARGFKPFRTEWIIWSAELDVAGSIDFVMVHPESGELVLVDWKRCETSDDSFSVPFRGRRMLPPLSHLGECKLTKWALQVNVYRELLERYYGVRVCSMLMVVFHPTLAVAEEHWHERSDDACALLDTRRPLPQPQPQPGPESESECEQPPLKVRAVCTSPKMHECNG